MSRTRFNVEPPAVLRTREGRKLGKITSVTIELDPSVAEAIEVAFAAAAPGAMGQAVPVEEQQPSLGGQPSFEGGTGETFSDDDAIAAVWQKYVEVMSPRRKTLDPEGRKIIREALKVAGETSDVAERRAVAECEQAIIGCSLSDYHMAREDPSRYQTRRPKRYNKLSNILKGSATRGRTTREQLDYFIDIAEKGRRESSVTSERNARIQQAKRVVLDAYEYPRDEHLQERRARAEAWLEQNGIRVEREVGGRPIFYEA